VAVVAVLAAAGGLWDAGCQGGPKAPPQLPPPAVTATQAVVRDVPLYLDEIGTCSAVDTVAIRPQASGRITKVHFEEGADVEEGQPLFTIDPAPYQAALDQSKATQAQEEAALVLAQQELARSQKLYPRQAVSKEDLETKQNAVNVAQARIAAAKAAVEVAQVNLGYCFIRSPIAGKTGRRQLDEGNVVTANSGVVMLTIQRLDPIYADFTVTERELPAVRANMAQGPLKADVRLPDEPQQAARRGDVTFLDNMVSENTGTIRLRATLANADRHFWPGRFVNVRLILRMLPGAVLVPSQATQISQKGPFVYVVGHDGTAAIRPVQLGQRHGDMVAVEGLAPGETVIVTGQLTVAPGAKVRVTTQPAGVLGGGAPGAPGGAVGKAAGGSGAPKAGGSGAGGGP
jgi:multidrug efflux system membrane fusion protein